MLKKDEKGPKFRGGPAYYVETKDLKTNGFEKGTYFQPVETQALSTRRVDLMCSTCTSALPLKDAFATSATPSFIAETWRRDTGSGESWSFRPLNRSLHACTTAVTIPVS